MSKFGALYTYEREMGCTNNALVAIAITKKNVLKLLFRIEGGREQQLGGGGGGGEGYPPLPYTIIIIQIFNLHLETSA